MLAAPLALALGTDAEADEPKVVRTDGKVSLTVTGGTVICPNATGIEYSYLQGGSLIVGEPPEMRMCRIDAGFTGKIGSTT